MWRGPPGLLCREPSRHFLYRQGNVASTGDAAGLAAHATCPCAYAHGCADYFDRMKHAQGDSMKIIRFATLSALFCTGLWAQGTSQIQGIVSDATGAAV